MSKNNLQKLELTWIGKGDEPKLEPRILIEDLSKSNSLNLETWHSYTLLLYDEKKRNNRMNCLHMRRQWYLIYKEGGKVGDKY
mgnify:FL=1